MYSMMMPYGLGDLLAALDGAAEIPHRPEQSELFFDGEPAAEAAPFQNTAPVPAGPAALPEAAHRLYEFSINAFDAIVHAWMSELPIEAELLRFGRKVLAAGEGANRERAGVVPRGTAAEQEIARWAADRAASDRGDPDVRVVSEAAYRARHEVHRMLGFLRFRADEQGLYVARCAPDHFVLPALGDHFRRRFGGHPWAIIDEKRSLSLRWTKEGPRLRGLDCSLTSPLNGEAAGKSDIWEDLWRHYHKTINNESRNNPGLQCRFMPKRYWKYLVEMPAQCLRH